MTTLSPAWAAASRPSGISRRSFLLGAAGAGLLSLTGPASRTALAAPAATAWPGMPSPSQLWSWEQQLVRFGTRYTGSDGHNRFVDWLAGQFAAVPGFRLQSDSLTFNRWLAQGWSLSVRPPGAAPAAVPVTYYYPYSGNTPAAGVTAPLVDVGTYTPAAPGSSGTGVLSGSWAAASGKIALVRVLPSTLTLDGVTLATGGYEPGKSSLQAAGDYTDYAKVLTNPAWSGITDGVPLLDAKKAGVKGVVCVWTGLPDDEVVNQYNPFITPYPADTNVPTKGDPGCPALWVGEATGHSLAQAAAGGATATLTLTADITERATTNTLWGWLPGSGRTGESLIVNTHTDGPNATEENGALGMLALARYFAGRPHQRDLYFVLVTGHFQLPQFTAPVTDFAPTGQARAEVGSDATSIWLRDHKDRWQGKALAGLTVEHLGCTRWGTDAQGAYGPLGGYEWGATLTCKKWPALAPASSGGPEEQAYLQAVGEVNRSGWVDSPVATVQPNPLYLGEGAPLYAAGLGTVSLIPLPPYLLQAGTAQNPRLLNLEQLDKNLMYAQVLAFARTIQLLDATPSAAF